MIQQFRSFRFRTPVILKRKASRVALDSGSVIDRRSITGKCGRDNFKRRYAFFSNVSRLSILDCLFAIFGILDFFHVDNTLHLSRSTLETRLVDIRRLSLDFERWLYEDIV